MSVLSVNSRLTDVGDLAAAAATATTGTTAEDHPLGVTSDLHTGAMSHPLTLSRNTGSH